jgi:two-component system OmpR family sensor kinase
MTDVDRGRQMPAATQWPGGPPRADHRPGASHEAEQTIASATPSPAPSQSAQSTGAPRSEPVRLNTVSLRLRVTLAAMAVLGVMVMMLGVTVNAVFVAQSNRSLNVLLTARVQLARQLAKGGAGPQMIVNRAGADGVVAHLVLRNGMEFGATLPAGSAIKTREVTLAAPTKVDGAVLTLAVDTSLVSGAHRTLRRVLIIIGLLVLLVSMILIAFAVRLALRPLSAMAGLAQQITAGRRGSRLGPTRTDTEIGRTAQAFDEMLDELEGAEARARRAEEQTRAFLADAAHELRTPITGVQAAAETLLHHGSQLPREDRQRLETLLIAEAQRAGRLVSDLLAAARLDSGVELDVMPLSLGTVTHGEVERARLLQPTTMITLDGPDVIISADPTKLAAIIRNLIDNALRAAGPAGWVAVTLSQHGDRAVLEVADSGPGVPPRDRERIFERLVRLDSARSTDSGGSGLGLAIARGYARAHGGDLSCDEPRQRAPGTVATAQAGPGARFVLSLPIAGPAVS